MPDTTKPEPEDDKFTADLRQIEWLGKVEGGFSDFQPAVPEKPKAPPKKD